MIAPSAFAKPSLHLGLREREREGWPQDACLDHAPLLYHQVHGGFGRDRCAAHVGPRRSACSIHQQTGSRPNKYQDHTHIRAPHALVYVHVNVYVLVIVCAYVSRL